MKIVFNKLGEMKASPRISKAVTSISVSEKNNSVLEYISKRTGYTKTYLMNEILDHMLDYVEIEGDFNALN